MGRIVIDYIWLSVLGSVAFAAVEYFFSINTPNGTVITIIASMVTGQLYGGRTGQEVTSIFAWKVAVVLSLVSFLIGAVVLIGLSSLGESFIPEGISLGMVTVIGVIAIAISVLIIRFTFRWSVKQGAKRSPKRADPEIFE